MSTDEQALQQASQRYAGDLVERYGTGPERIPPRDLDAILDKVAGKGGDVTMLEKQLSGYVTMREVNKAKDNVDYKQVTEDFDDKLTQMLEDAGWGDAPADIGAEPPEPEPEEGHWTPGEGESFDRITDQYNAGKMSAELYEKLEVEHARETGRVPLH